MKEGKINIAKAKLTAGYYNKRLSDLASSSRDENASSFLKRSQITLVSRCNRQQQTIYSARKSSQSNIDVTLLKLQKQKKCIDELQEYIDELQNDKREKQSMIKQLIGEKQELIKKVEGNLQIGAFVSDKYKNINELVLMMNEQLQLFQREKKRWREEIRIKNKQLQSTKELKQAENTNLRKIYQQKLELLTQEWNAKQTKMTQIISKRQAEIQRISLQNNLLSQKQKNIDECQQMLRIRRQILQLQKVKNKENQMPNQDKYTSKHGKISDEIAMMRVQYSKLKSQHQGLMFELKYHKRQAQKDSKIIQELRQQLKKQEQRTARNQDRTVPVHNRQSSDTYSKMILELKQLKKQRQTFVDFLETTESFKQENVMKSKEIERLRQREEEQMQKINLIFQKIDLY